METGEIIDIEFQSTLPMRGVTRQLQIGSVSCEFQSTLPMRGVTGLLSGFLLRFIISIHTPHAGSDKDRKETGTLARVFQSTLPMRGVTVSMMISCPTFAVFQSTLPMRGVTHCNAVLSTIFQFQSTLPMRGVTAIV